MILDERGIESGEKIGEQRRTPQVRMDINLGVRGGCFEIQ